MGSEMCIRDSHRGVAHRPPCIVGVDEAPAGFFEDELVAFAHGQHVAAGLVRLGRDRFLGDQLRDDFFGGGAYAKLWCGNTPQWYGLGGRTNL